MEQNEMMAVNGGEKRETATFAAIGLGVGIASAFVPVLTPIAVGATILGFYSSLESM